MKGQSARFSFRTRKANLQELARRDAFDLLVIGAGITGAGVARDAVLRGLSVALVERKDFAAGTSSRSSKLVHGGLRYLQQGDVGLVREAATERYAVRRLAPYLARPTQVMVPVAGRTEYAKIKLGLWTFDHLAGVPVEERYRMIGRDEVLALEPSLRIDEIYGAGLYYECLTDDARLVLATVKSTACLGAIVVNHAEVVAFAHDGGRVSGVTVRDSLSGDQFRVGARVIINATGPWVDQVRLSCEHGEKPRLTLTKGIHLVVPREKLPLARMVIMRAADGRSVFAVPHGTVTYLGTTDTFYNDPEDYPAISAEDAEYLLEAAAHRFSVVPLRREDVVGAWAGLRPLLAQAGKRPSELSRKDEIVTGPTGLQSIAGGKLTTFRKMAERIVDAVVARLSTTGSPVPEALGKSKEVPLAGGETGTSVDAYTHRLQTRRPNVHPGVVERLVELYGSDAESIVTAIDEDTEGDAPGASNSYVSRAEVEYAVREEMALTLEDMLERRCRVLLWDLDRGLSVAESAAAWMGDLLDWSPRRVAAEVAHYRELATSLIDFQGAAGSAPEVPRAARG